MTRRLAPYLIALTTAALAVVGLLLLIAPIPPADPLLLLVLVVVIGLAERAEVQFHWGREQGSVTLLEVVLTAALLSVPAIHVVAAVAPVMVLARPSLLRTPVKVVYNVATTVLGTAVAAVILTALPPVGPLVDGRPVLGVLAGMIGYGAVSGVAFAGLLSRLHERGAIAMLRDQLPLHLAQTLGTVSVGVVLAAVWQRDPSLAPFVLAPAAALHIALRSSVRAAASLAAQQAEHDRLVRVVDGASDGIVLLDAEANVQVWNPAMARLTGIPAEAAVGHRVGDVLTDAIRRGTVAVEGRWTLADAEPGHAHREEDAQLTDDGGVVRQVRESHAFTFDDRGRCTGAVVVVRDVSRQRELERLRTDFVARVSHELRTPLTPIRGFASVLLRRHDVLEPEQREEALTRIVEQADHLHGLVEDLLLVTHVEHEDLADMVRSEPFDVRSSVRAAVDDLELRNPDRTVRVAADADLPDAYADPDRVREIVGALLDNADRYGAEDGPIEVEVDQRDGAIRIRVIDHGPGIAPADREAVFERFHRLEDPMTMRTGGVGLGLYIGRQLAQAMQGGLDLEPTARGSGCTFVLRLPFAESTAVTVAPSGPPGTDGTTPDTSWPRPRTIADLVTDEGRRSGSTPTAPEPGDRP